MHAYLFSFLLTVFHGVFYKQAGNKLYESFCKFYLFIIYEGQGRQEVLYYK